MTDQLTIAPVAVSCGADAEFLDFAALQKQFHIGRSLAYSLLADGSIHSVCLRRRGKIKGKRLISADSVRQFLASQPTDFDPQLSENCRKANRARRVKSKH
jgi:hypothetical protein